MRKKKKHLYLSGKEMDELLLKFVTVFGSYNYCEALVLLLMCTEMGEA